MAGINLFPDGIPDKKTEEQSVKSPGVNLFPDGIPESSMQDPGVGSFIGAAQEANTQNPIMPALKEIGEAATVGTAETIGGLASGMALWPISKLRGAGELLRGSSEEEARKVEEEIASMGYQPKTESAKAAMGMVGDVIDVITWPAKLAGETAKELGYPKTGYLTELAGELAMFKGVHKVGGKVAKVPKEHATAKAVFDSKMSELTEAQRIEVRKIAETKGVDLVKMAKESKLTGMERAYEVVKDRWFGKKDRRIFEADIEARLLKKEIKDGLKPSKEAEYVANPAIKIKGQVVEGDYAEGGHIKIMERIDSDPVLKAEFDAGRYQEGATTHNGRFLERKNGVDFADIKGRDVNEIKNAFVSQDPKKGKMGALYDEAMQIYIDLKGNPDDLGKYYDSLTKEQQKVVDLSQNLPPEIKAVADKISESYKVIGEEAVDATVIRNMIENYAGRKWDLGPGKSMEAMKKFGTTTGHAKARRIGTILEGWSEGYDLKIKSATENLRTYKHEMLRTMADKKFVDELIKVKDLEGNPLLSTSQLDGYVQVKHPNMTKWEWAGEVEQGKVYGKNFFATEDGQLFERRTLYAPKNEAKNINNILGISSLAEVRGIKGITKFNEISKAWILQSSLFHHMAFMRSYYLPGGFKGKGQTPRQAYKSGIEAIEKSDPVLLHGVEKGLTIGLKQDWMESSLRESTHIGRLLDKNRATKVTKDWVNKFREGQADFLFGEFGAGLKAKAYILEFRDQMKKYPDANPDVVAKRVATLINEDFGGLHLGRIGRNPTTQHIFRLFALAPDWTESNIRTMAKAMKNMSGDQAELHMYRKFWGGVVVKGLGVTALANYALAGGDVEEMTDRYKKAWKSGNMNWMKIDITPIYEGIYNSLGFEPSGQSKYFSVIGHFQDPMKFIAHPVKSAKHKQSVVAGMAMEALTGTDYTGRRRFTTLEELVTEGSTVKWGGSGPVSFDQFPSYALSQIAGTQPIQLQALLAWGMGEQEGFDALSQSFGLRTTTTYEQKSRMKKGLRKMKGLK